MALLGVPLLVLVFGNVFSWFTFFNSVVQFTPVIVLLIFSGMMLFDAHKTYASRRIKRLNIE